jgi:hypothetical protein
MVRPWRTHPKRPIRWALWLTNPFASGTLNWFAMYNYTGDYFHDMDNFLEEDGYGVMNAKVHLHPKQ